MKCFLAAGRVSQLSSALKHAQGKSEFTGPSLISPKNYLVLQLFLRPVETAQQTNKGKHGGFFFFLKTQDMSRAAEWHGTRAVYL